VNKMATFFHLDAVVFENGQIIAVLLCFVLAIMYVGSLYIYTDIRKSRDHPDIIKQRFLRVAIVCLVSLPSLWLCSTTSHSYKARNVFVWVGIRLSGLIPATILPLILTMVLFMGPLALHYMDGIFRIYKDPKYWIANTKNLMWLRNHIVAPLSEEYIFRACMLALLVPSFSEVPAMIVCPLFFGVAHFHHAFEKIREGMAIKTTLMQTLFQLSYTTVFGMYSAFLFLRTGHLMAPVIAHAFCNHMGFPDFAMVQAYPAPTKHYLIGAFIVGLVSWYFLLYPLTEPWIYSNDLYVV